MGGIYGGGRVTLDGIGAALAEADGEQWDKSETDAAKLREIGEAIKAYEGVPFASLDGFVERGFSLGITEADGEAVVSEGNAAPAGKPGVTSFVGVDYEDADGVSERALLDAIEVGDWMRARAGDSYVIARVAHVTDDAPNTVKELWFNPANAIEEGGDLIGDGTVRFWRIAVDGLRATLPTGARPDVAGATDLLLRDFGAVSVEHLGLHVRPQATEPLALYAIWDTTPGNLGNAGSGRLGYINGQLWWNMGPNMSVAGGHGTTVPLADVLELLNAHHSISVAGGYLTGKPDSVTETNGTYVVTFDPAAVTSGDAPADGTTVAVEIESDLMNRSEIEAIAGAAFRLDLGAFDYSQADSVLSATKDVTGLGDGLLFGYGAGALGVEANGDAYWTSASVTNTVGTRQYLLEAIKITDGLRFRAHRTNGAYTSTDEPDFGTTIAWKGPTLDLGTFTPD